MTYLLSSCRSSRRKENSSTNVDSIGKCSHSTFTEQHWKERAQEEEKAPWASWTWERTREGKREWDKVATYGPTAAAWLRRSSASPTLSESALTTGSVRSPGTKILKEPTSTTRIQVWCSKSEPLKNDANSLQWISRVTTLWPLPLFLKK